MTEVSENRVVDMNKYCGLGRLDTYSPLPVQTPDWKFQSRLLADSKSILTSPSLLFAQHGCRFFFDRVMDRILNRFSHCPDSPVSPAARIGISGLEAGRLSGCLGLGQFHTRKLRSLRECLPYSSALERSQFDRPFIPSRYPWRMSLSSSPKGPMPA